MPSFGWDIPFYYITGGLFLLFALALLASRFNREWEDILFKTATAGFWAIALLWLIKFLYIMVSEN